MTRQEKYSAIFFITMLFIVHHFFFYPPVTEEARTDNAVYDIEYLVASGNSARIQEGLQHYLADNISIKLHMNYGVMDERAAEDNIKPAITYDFNKRLFMAYLDNVLRSLTAFAFDGEMTDFAISGDWKSARAIFTSTGSAEGESRFLTKLRNVRFSYDAICRAELTLEGRRPMLTSLDCKIFAQKPQPLTKELGDE